jgi:lysophospholipase L1-like esterase
VKRSERRRRARPARTHWLSNLALACGGALAALLVAEVMLRLLGIGEIAYPRRVVYAGQSREWCCGPEVMVGQTHRFQPGERFQHCYSSARPYFDASGCVTYRINQWGYRGADFARAKPPGVYRIVLLGDSFTFGEGTPDASIYSAVLDAALRERQIDGRHVEIVNLGMPAEDSGTELVTYREFARTLAPDRVVVQWHTNDFPSTAVQKDHLRLIGMQYREMFSSAADYRWSRLLSALYLRSRMPAISRDLVATTRAELDAGRASFDDIGRLRQLTATDGAAFTLLIFPEIIRFTDYPYAAIVEALRAYCVTEGIAVVDLLPALRKHRDADLWVHDTDHHPNPVAHAIAAEELLKTLK